MKSYLLGRGSLLGMDQGLVEVSLFSLAGFNEGRGGWLSWRTSFVLMEEVLSLNPEGWKWTGPKFYRV